MSNTNFFYVKISCPKEVDELNFYHLLKKLSKGVLEQHTLYNIPNNLHLAKNGDIIIIQIGGDSSNKKKYLKQNIITKYDNYKNGIHAIGFIKNINKDQKEVNINIIGLKSSISKSDLYYFPQFINNLGGTTKGIPNQAGLYELEYSIGLSLIDYLNLNNLLPSEVEELNELNSKNKLYEIAYKNFQSKFSNKKTTNDLIEKLPKKSVEPIKRKPLIDIKNKFIDWINKEDNYKKSYDGLVTELVLDFWNKAYFNNQLFMIDMENLAQSISKIESLILYSDNSEWINYSQATSKGAPMAVLGKNNYLRFLYELSNEIKSNNSLLNQQLAPQIFKSENFKKACEISGLNYPPQLISRYIASLATKPFVLLSGLSGSGKTKIAEAFAKWICESEKQYALVPVGADWTNREPLLGYPNALKDNEYVKPDNDALDLLMRAENDESRPYFLILDEMNLSHVERYFADFLSTMESKNDIPLHKIENEIKNIPKRLKLPPNVFIVGTVNIDETTYMFSPKVLDRANTIEFRVKNKDILSFLKEPNDVDLDSLKGLGSSMGSNFVDIATKKENYELTEKQQHEVYKFFKELQKSGAEFGYRTAFEISKLIFKLEEFGLNSEDDKIDVAIMQKLLPKLHGSRTKLSRTLKPLAEYCLKNVDDDFEDNYFNNFDKIDFEKDVNIKYKLSFEKIMRMYKNAVENGFASYAEA
ncbi:hypothetical protein FF125_16915 [Aureibaculum algae]|uniref:AAA+ ATPase domain-containing protein n=1 Tax=Aureibaculum algae TaxID=2584122 RepID=A0A5B7TZC9_9FLAO|nr:hypothetical protein [Aureibaculum algae]QCX40042.1 hypothetical protein FF125_16915 [Aureibaculum algae]